MFDFDDLENPEGEPSSHPTKEGSDSPKVCAHQLPAAAAPAVVDEGTSSEAAESAALKESAITEAAQEEAAAVDSAAAVKAELSEITESKGGSADAAAGAGDPPAKDKDVGSQVGLRPNAKYRVGMHLENVGSAIMRKAEDLTSEQVRRLEPDSQVEVIAIGTDTTGNRVQVRAVDGQEGWVSITSQNAAQLWRESEAEAKPTDKQATQRHDHGKPTSRFNVGDMVEATGTMIVRAAEPLDSMQVKRLSQNTRMRVVKIGTGPTGKRLQICDDGNQTGWVSAVGADGLELLRVVHDKKEEEQEDEKEAEAEQGKQQEVELFGGEGRSLGGTPGNSSSANPRAAALAAAELRQASAYAHGISDKKAEEMKEKERRELLISKITEIYTSKGEEVPLPIKSAGSKSLQKHLEFLQGKSVTPQSTASQTSSSAAPQTAQAAAPKPAMPTPAPAANPVTPTTPAKPATPAPAPAASSATAHAQGTRKGFSSQLFQNQVQRTSAGRGAAPPATLRDSRQPQDATKAGAAQPQQATPTLQDRQQEVMNAAVQNAAVLTPEQQRLELMQRAQYEFGLDKEQLQALLELESIGFDYGRALEAFLTCERNQEMAVNFLLENQQVEEAEEAAAAAAVEQAKANVAAQQVLNLQSGAKVSAENLFLSLAEWEAVRRIEELGFERNTALQAYLHFDRDEEAAGNLLLM